MANEVEEFLRRVAEMRAAAAAKNRQSPPPAPKPAQPAKQKKQQRVPRAVPVELQTGRPMPLAAEVVDASVAELGNRVGQQVSEDLRGTDRIVEHTRHLGEEVDAANAKMQAHMHQVFDHQLGRLKQGVSEVPTVSPERPTSDFSLVELQRMLRSPNSVRDAIVMAEILRRPEL